MSEIYVCTHSDSGGHAVLVYYWPSDKGNAHAAPSACCRWFWFADMKDNSFPKLSGTAWGRSIRAQTARELASLRPQQPDMKDEAVSAPHKPARSTEPSFVMFLPPSHPWLKLTLDRLDDIVGPCVEVRITQPIPTLTGRKEQP